MTEASKPLRYAKRLESRQLVLAGLLALSLGLLGVPLLELTLGEVDPGPGESAGALGDGDQPEPLPGQ